MTEEQPEYEIISWPSRERRFDWLWPLLLVAGVGSMVVAIHAPKGSASAAWAVGLYFVFLMATLIRLNVWLSRLTRQRMRRAYDGY